MLLHINDMKIQEILAEQQLRIDVPNEDWLQSHINYAIKKGLNQYGVPYADSTTAYIAGNKPVSLPVSILQTLPGMSREQSNVRKDDLEWLKKTMKETGKLPIIHGEEYAPLIQVMYDGSAWVNEGNHRIMAAAALGWNKLPVELRYYDGGERIKDGPLYPKKIGLG